VRTHERVEVLSLPELLLGKALEGCQHAAARLMRGIEQTEAGLVSRRLLHAALTQHRTHDNVVAAQGNAAAGTCNLARRIPAGHGAAHHQADAQNRKQQALGGVASDAASQLRHVSAHDVAGLVGDDTDDLVGRLGLGQSAGVDEDIAAVDHEGIEAFVPDDAHRNVLGGEPGGLEDRDGVVLEEVLNLAVANQR